MKIGLAIAIRREEIGLTQDELAQAVGVSKSTICRWESGDISNMKRDKIQRLADALKVSPLALLDDETDGLALAQQQKETEWIELLQKMSVGDLQTLKAVAMSLIEQRREK